MWRREGLRPVAITSGGSLEITVEDSEKEVVVRLSGLINVDSSPDLRERLMAILQQPFPPAVTVDLTGVLYVETSGIATLIEALRIARHHQTIFCLRGLGGPVLRLFEVTGVLALFEASNCGQKAS